MHGMRRIAPAMLLFALTGCSDDSGASTNPPPHLGARTPVPSSPPPDPMDTLERPVADRLAPRLREEGLTLQYVDCPAWPGEVPFSASCRGYVDGVVGEVEVELSSGEDGAVVFDAWLEDGIVATSRLVTRLEEKGWSDVDCGSTPAYPAREGMRIVCEVHDEGEASYVVATVTDRRGEVRIEDY